jgi:hypothetical protein
MIDADTQSKIEKLCGSAMGYANYAVDHVNMENKVHVLTSRVIGCNRKFVNIIPLDPSTGYVVDDELDRWTADVKADMQSMEGRPVASFSTDDTSFVAKIDELMNDKRYLLTCDLSKVVEKVAVSIINTSLFQGIIRDAVHLVEVMQSIRKSSFSEPELMDAFPKCDDVNDMIEADCLLDFVLSKETFLIGLGKNPSFLQYIETVSGKSTLA